MRDKWWGFLDILYFMKVLKVFWEFVIFIGYCLVNRFWNYYFFSLFCIYNEIFNIWSYFVGIIMIFFVFLNFFDIYGFMINKYLWFVMMFGICVIIISLFSIVVYFFYFKFVNVYYMMFLLDYIGVIFYFYGLGVFLMYVCLMKVFYEVWL